MMHPKPLVSIQIVVRNGEKYIRHCLDSVARQTYGTLEVIVLDNASTDTTVQIIEQEYPHVRLMRHEANLGMWPGQEYVLAHSSGIYVCSLSVDVILDSDFIARCVDAIEGTARIGAVQGKIFQYTIEQLNEQGVRALTQSAIDTCGFAMSRSRKVINIGHGTSHQYEQPMEIFGVEGAVPFFRRSALEECRIQGHIWDPDFFWYGDDLDLAWRMHVFGFIQIFEPRAIAWHDRSTTKGSATIPIIGQLQRRVLRQKIPLEKRKLDWSNTRFTIIKNDYIINLFRDAPAILVRELAVLGYIILFEPAVLLEVGRFIRLLPRMLRRRKDIMHRAQVSANTMHRWFQ